MTDKLTDAEIKKALECCANCESCDYETTDCPLGKEMECRSILAECALDLINRKEGENNKNENIIRIADKTIATLQAEIENLIAEIERLKANEEMAEEYADALVEYTKAEADKEFAENNFGGCKGCINIGFRYPYASMYPCNNCIRADMKDYYEAKELVGE